MLVSIYQLTIVTGILCSYTINYWLHDADNNWRWMFATGVVPSVLFFAGLLFIPESPRWLYKAGRKEESLKVLTRIGGESLAKTEIKEIAESLKDNYVSVTVGELLKPSSRKVILVGFFLAILVQISGINTIVDYAPKILLAAGVEIKNALLQTSLIGLINFLFTFVAILLIDKTGRTASLSDRFYGHGSYIGDAGSIILFRSGRHIYPGLHNVVHCLFCFLYRTCILDSCF